MRMSFGYASGTDGPALVSAAVDMVLRGMEDLPHQVIASAASALASRETFEALCEALPNTKISMQSSCRGQMTIEGISSLSLLAFHEPKGSFGCAAGELVGDARMLASRVTLDAMADADRTGELPSLFWISSSPGHEESIIAGIQDVVGQAVPIFGATATDDALQGDGFLGAQGRCGSTLLTITVFYITSPFGYAFRGGYLPTERAAIVTRAEGRIVREIDGKPAALVYDAWTHGIVSTAKSGNIAQASLSFPLGQVVGQLGEVPYFRLSQPWRALPDNSLECMANVSEGEQVVLMHGSKETLLHRPARQVAAALDAAGIKPGDAAGVLMAFSASCMLSVRPRMSFALDGVRRLLGDIPLLGIFGLGEQGCFLAGENKHANLMVSTIVFGA